MYIFVMFLIYLIFWVVILVGDGRIVVCIILCLEGMVFGRCLVVIFVCRVGIVFVEFGLVIGEFIKIKFDILFWLYIGIVFI